MGGKKHIVQRMRSQESVMLAQNGLKRQKNVFDCSRITGSLSLSKKSDVIKERVKKLFAHHTGNTMLFSQKYFFITFWLNFEQHT